MAKPNEPPGAELGALVDDLLQSTGMLLRRLRSEAAAEELSLSQAAVLGRLARQGDATTADLARAEGVKPQSMGATLAGLEQQGLVARRPHPTDGRQFLFRLTPAGQAARDRRRLLKHKWLTEALGGVTPAERAALGSALAILRRLSAS
ncbi:MarR family winged helix-turn-helix transcriptional regulator [Sphingomonas morindae]|uniref:MarR family transcriptional regulator n=1 Tax=Sphingomonas morindae TaxID=1541170 RepID=A0ABY4XCF3_9SPHN|nr:MarR family transcriptional regulator [Sphingomonas morindae]USI74650.1 MarR family transcriptional regulator [Sphingomonas morindae]